MKKLILILLSFSFITSCTQKKLNEDVCKNEKVASISFQKEVEKHM